MPPGGDGARRGRRGTVALAALLVAAAVAGLLVWQPWTGSGQGDADAGGASPSPRSSTPAVFPDVPLLVRLDMDPGSSECHSVIGRRDSTTDNPEQLIDGTCDALPQWSPDRESFAFTRKTADGSAVWTANADGSDVRRIGAISGGRVSWSPDGERLAVLRRDADGVQQLYAVNVSDGSAQQLTTGTGKVDDPAWSPDGKRIAVCLQKTSGWQVHVVDPAQPGAEPRQVTHQSRRALDPVWSPDGRYFAYTAGAPDEGTGVTSTSPRPTAAATGHWYGQPPRRWTRSGPRTASGWPSCGGRSTGRRSGRSARTARAPASSPPAAHRRGTLPGAEVCAEKRRSGCHT